MYGTIARMRVMPGAGQALMKLAERFEKLNIPGCRVTYVYRSDAEPNTFWLAVAFADKAAYQANAENPAQDARYREMRALLAADPEWHDGEIIFPKG